MRISQKKSHFISLRPTSFRIECYNFNLIQSLEANEDELCIFIPFSEFSKNNNDNIPLIRNLIVFLWPFVQEKTKGSY
jgi:hypothetical protein